MTATSAIEFTVGPEQFFRIDEVEQFPDGSGYVGRISLRSGSFALQGLKFHFDRLDEFLSQTRRLYDTLSGSAELGQQWERNHLSLSATMRGHIRVAGHFELYDGETQRLEFSFASDQTFLPAFITSVERVCHELKKA
jgi:hypothetical protein